MSKRKHRREFAGQAQATAMAQVQQPVKKGYADGEKVWIVFDERAAGGDSDNAAVLESIGEDEAKNNDAAINVALETWRGTPFALFSYTFKDGQAIEDDGNPVHVHRIK